MPTTEDAETTKSTKTPKQRRQWRRTFLEALSRCGNVTQSARRAKVDRVLPYRLYHKYPKFRKAWDAAMEKYADRVERVIDDRAIKGWPQPVYQNGKLVGHIQKFDNKLLLERARSLRPEKWGRKKEAGDTTVNVAVLNSDGTPGETIALTAADLEAARALMRQANPPEALPPADAQTGT